MVLGLWTDSHATDRAYCMMLTERTFSGHKHTYVALGHDRDTRTGQLTNTWNLPGGKKDAGDRTRGVAAARELYEETGKYIDKRRDPNFWSSLGFYAHGRHKIFIIAPGQVKVNIAKLNSAVNSAINSNLSHEYKEMAEYELIKLTDLVKLAKNQNIDGQSKTYHHPTHGNMTIDGWLLTTLKKADRTSLKQYYK